MRLYVFAGLFLCLAACRTPVSEREGSVLASVGETEITVEDFERSYVARLIATGGNDTRESRSLHLNNLIDAELLRLEARRLGLAEDSLGRAKLQMIRKKTLGGLFFEQAFLDDLPPPTEAEIRHAFARWKEKAIVRHLFYRDSTLAQQAYERLEAGVPFLEEAQRCYKTAAFDSSAGYLGPVGYFEVDDAFAEAAFSLRQGEYSRPVRSRFGYHIILLEDKLVSPLLTESEFQTRRKGIASKWRLRKRRLEGDRFVRSFMEALNVRVNPDAINALAATIQLIEKSVVAEPPQLLVDDRPVDLQELRVATPLAWYTFEGKELTFTLGDYAAWFDQLPFAEARHRTAASVGRALRNEAMARAGASEKLGGKPEAIRENLFQERIFLAGRMRDEVFATAAENISDERIDSLLAQKIRIPTDSTQQRQAMRDRLASMVVERQLLEHLRAQTSIQVDSALFDAMALLNRPEEQ